ncbi:helix-turn-helix domain-containing protein [Streptomyces sp. G3]|uniref:PucR family transcriptional regulator n=1 Tax=unclassified Streptomyces TaxID=2593676 RepID=UPI001BAEA422|nr:MULTISPECIES: helix-turn-helix domain-containing protein [unclassified Streptomyces]MCM1938096.1 helix-turn-helix domain-containing protein [Streptomyces sp. G3]QUW95678.1 Purine catabolism regulatory protein [Streptomyces sp. V17-9]WKX16854.1 helix-turn-helix domain-containing protein [Streptomyces sp. HUAS CX7]
MQHAVRSRAAIRTGLTPVPRPRTPGVTSLIDADALRVLHRAARTLLDDLPDLTDRLVALLQEQEPAYRAAVTKDAAATWQEAHRSLRHSVASLLDPRGARDAARRCSWRIGAARAEQGLPLDALLHAFRLGGSLVWQRLVEETSRAAPEDVRLLVHVAADVWNFVDEHCTLVADAYRQTEWQIGRRRENRARLLAAGLLDGTGRIADLPEAARALDLPEQGRYVVVAVTGGPPARSDAARAVAVPPGARVHWHAGPEVDYGIVLVGAVEGLADPGPPRTASHAPVPGLRIGVGSPVEGLAAVGDARRLADTALDICPAAGGTVRLADQLPAALVVSSPELGRALAEKVLGPLLRLEPADREVLLDTLTTWLECDGSAQRAGERLYCHRNTVLNRLRRCEQLTGRSLARPADVVEFSLALTARRVLRD